MSTPSNPAQNPHRNNFKRQIAPGIWEDTAGGIHYNVPELLALFDLPDTPEDRARAMASIKDTLSKQVPWTKIIERHSPED